MNKFESGDSYLPKSFQCGHFSKRFPTSYLTSGSSQPTKTKAIDTPCFYCKETKMGTQLSKYLNSKLYTSYSSSQNYYYLKDINSILANQRTKPRIAYSSLKDYLFSKSGISKFLDASASIELLVELSEYYKYHRDIPRIFSTKEFELYFEYHDKKRKVDYIKVMNLLKGEDKEDMALEQHLELIRKRKTVYKPMLKGLTPTSIRQKEAVNTSNTVGDIFDKLQSLFQGRNSLCSSFHFSRTDRSPDVSSIDLVSGGQLKHLCTSGSIEPTDSNSKSLQFDSDNFDKDSEDTI